MPKRRKPVSRCTSIWLDTESDGFHGRMLSLALVTRDGGSFYGVLPPLHLVDAWAVRHVLPVLGPPTHMDDIDLAEGMAHWLQQFEEVNVIAAWHRDLHHFFGLLGPRPGLELATCRIRASLKSWLNGPPTASKHGPPHNALADAFHLRDLDLMAVRSR